VTYDGSDRKQVRSREKEAKLDESNRIAYTKQIMSDLFGRQWMHDLLLRCYIFGEPFVQGSPDGTAHNLGKQIIGKQIFADVVTHCPTQYVQMMQEASAKEILHDRRYSDDRATPAEHNGSSDPGRDPEGPITEYDPYGGAET
jgi:hypothetical protein